MRGGQLPRGRTIVFVDNSNVFHGARAAGWRITRNAAARMVAWCRLGPQGTLTPHAAPPAPSLFDWSAGALTRLARTPVGPQRGLRRPGQTHIEPKGFIRQIALGAGHGAARSGHVAQAPRANTCWSLIHVSPRSLRASASPDTPVPEARLFARHAGAAQYPWMGLREHAL
jgi:hypothetical protein